MPEKGKYTKEDLINGVIDMRINKSASVKTILDFLMKDLGYSRASAYEYLKWARESIAESYNTKHTAGIEESLAEMESVMEYARNSKNYKLWFEIRKEINKVRGLHAPERHEISGKVDHTGIEVSFIYNTINNPIEVKNLNDSNEAPN